MWNIWQKSQKNKFFKKIDTHSDQLLLQEIY